MIVPPYIRRALKGWLNWREARQRQHRREMMFRADPGLLAAHERLCRKRGQHDATAQELRELQDRVHNLLRRSVSHG